MGTNAKVGCVSETMGIWTETKLAVTTSMDRAQQLHRTQVAAQEPSSCRRPASSIEQGSGKIRSITPLALRERAATKKTSARRLTVPLYHFAQNTAVVAETSAQLVGQSAAK